MVASCALLSNVAFATETPLTTSIKEFDAVIHSYDLNKMLAAEDQLKSIKKHGPGYKMETKLHKVKATIEYEDPDNFGNQNIRVHCYFVEE